VRDERGENLSLLKQVMTRKKGEEIEGCDKSIISNGKKERVGSDYTATEWRQGGSTGRGVYYLNPLLAT